MLIGISEFIENAWKDREKDNEFIRLGMDMKKVSVYSPNLVMIVFVC
jgi:hypothetical protein